MLSDIMRGENCACYQPHQMEVLGVNSRRDAEQDWLIHILDTIDEGIHAVDVDGVTIFYNAAAGRMDGLAPSDVIGKHVLAAFPSLENETSTLLQVLKTGRAIHDQPQIYTNYLGVKVHTVNTTLPIVSGGKVVGALEVAKDLTQSGGSRNRCWNCRRRLWGIGGKGSCKGNTEGRPMRSTDFRTCSHRMRA